MIGFIFERWGPILSVKHKNSMLTYPRLTWFTEEKLRVSNLCELPYSNAH